MKTKKISKAVAYGVRCKKQGCGQIVAVIGHYDRNVIDLMKTDVSETRENFSENIFILFFSTWRGHTLSAHQSGVWFK